MSSWSSTATGASHSSSSGKSIHDSLVMLPSMKILNPKKRSRPYYLDQYFANDDDLTGTTKMTLAERRQIITKVYPNFIQSAAKRIHSVKHALAKEQNVQKKKTQEEISKKDDVGSKNSKDEKETESSPKKNEEAKEPATADKKESESSLEMKTNKSSSTPDKKCSTHEDDDKDDDTTWTYTTLGRKQNFIQQLQKEKEKLQKDMEKIEQKRKDIFTKQHELWGVYKYGLQTISKLTDLQDAPDAILPGNF
mmetsp:Transcript_14552/g.20559  ORF Transcript_14552/g.20559 Transcript_14552/m.20559 type:complete len:251 (+) Transcript_14552:166-918(+)